MTIDANPVTPTLWQGSFPPPGSDVRRAKFDVVVFCAMELQPPAELYHDVKVIHAPNDDSADELTRKANPPTYEQLYLAVAAALKVVEALRAGKRVLVTCRQGRNRSGLVSAIALRLMGASPEQAVARVKAARTNALTNSEFVKAIFAMRMPEEAAAREVATS